MRLPPGSLFSCFSGRVEVFEISNAEDEPLKNQDAPFASTLCKGGLPDVCRLAMLAGIVEP